MNRTSRRARAAACALALCLAVSGCSGSGPRPEPTATTSITGEPAVDLTRPGAARRAVDSLVAAAGTLPVVKVDLTATSAMLSAVKDGRVVAWQWTPQGPQPAESDIAYIEQAAFRPADYNLDDLGALFARAARISGSSTNQELQIVEYDHGEVVMTVTTRPESMPVFLRADGTPINRLDFTTPQGFAEAIRDTTGQQPVLALGWSEGDGFWADSGARQEGVVERRTRQARVPAWRSSRKAGATGPTFPASQVDPAVLARLVRTLPAERGRPRAEVSFEVRRLHQMALPVITFDVGGEKVVTTLSGTDITQSVGG